MREVITVSLPTTTKKKLDKISKQAHTNRSDIIRKALDIYLTKLEFHRIREKLIPEARAQGIFKDEDVFRLVS